MIKFLLGLVVGTPFGLWLGALLRANDDYREGD